MPLRGLLLLVSAAASWHAQQPQGAYAAHAAAATGTGTSRTVGLVQTPQSILTAHSATAAVVRAKTDDSIDDGRDAAAAAAAATVTVRVSDEAIGDEGAFIGIGWNLLPNLAEWGWEPMTPTFINEVYGKRLAELRPGWARAALWDDEGPCASPFVYP